MIEKITRLIELITPTLKNGKQFLISLISIALMTVSVTVFEKYVDYKMSQMVNNVIEEVDDQVRNTVVEVVDSTNVTYTDRINKAIQHYPEIDIRIDALLTKLNEKLNTGKSAVGIFHNGSKTYNGYPFLKFSLTNEAIMEQKIIITSSLQLNQNVPYSRMAFYADKLNKDNNFICDSIEDLKEISKPDYFFMKEANVQSIALVPLRTSKGRVIGFLICCSYDTSVNFTKNLEFLEVIADLITLEIMSKYKEH